MFRSAAGLIGCLLLAAMAAGLVGAAPRPFRPGGPAALDVALEVKENAGVDTHAWPTSAVIPLPRGQFTDTADLGMAGTPSQVEALERWPGDESLRHVLVHFQASVPAGGSQVYHFTAGGQVPPPTPAVLTETSTTITVTTGPLKFTISKTAFNLIDQAWLDQDGNGQYENSERVISSHPQNGGVFVPRSGAGEVQYDTARSDLTISVEESGPMRVLVRVEAPARFITTTQHTHGFAARIYAYAGQPFVRVEYQLQNSDKNVVRSWPLYFEELRLDYRLNLDKPATLRFGLGGGQVYQAANQQGAYLAQERHNIFKIYNLESGATLYDAGTLPNGSGPEGFVDVSDASRGVTALVRNFWQTWPNGLEVDGQNRLGVQLFPRWSAQWYQKQVSPSGLYWLEDMQQVLKETLLYFHGPGTTNAELSRLGRTFQFYPTPVVPTAWSRQAQAMLDLEGVIPPQSTIPDLPSQPQPIYGGEGYEPYWYDLNGDYYGAGWVNFYDPQPGYRSWSCQHGGWPYSAANFIASGSPADYFTAEGWGLGELNLRPQWMAQYQQTADWNRLQLTDNPYCGGRWRIFEGHDISKLAAPPLAGTGAEEPVFYARDDQHAWYYHVAEAYWLTGSPWLRDWYRFIAEYRQVRLERLDPFPDTSSRATGHALNHALQAERITGKRALLDGIGVYLRSYLRPEQDPYYGDQLITVEETGGGYQTGYLMRAVVDYLAEVRQRGDWQAYAEGFNYLSGLVEWNYNFGNFSYYFDARQGGQGVSNGAGMLLIDPQAWYYWHTGKQKYLAQIQTYLASGLNGGTQPYGEFTRWIGQYEGRYFLYVTHTPRPDATPPPAINNLQALQMGSTTILNWAAPSDAVRYHIVWGSKPLVETNSTDAQVTNWWAANAVGPELFPTPGKLQSLAIPTSASGQVYAAIFTFDSADNMSAISNVARAISVNWKQLYLPLVQGR